MRSARAGFTLVEMMITTAVGAVVLAAVFALASFQARSMSAEQDVSLMQTSARLILESVAYDLRNAGFGTSFYAGAPAAAFGGQLVVSDAGGRALGVPAVRVMNNSDGSGGARPGSDAVTVLQVVGRSTEIPGVGAGNINVPAVPGGQAYLVADLSALQACASRLVLVSDLARQGQPASMLLEIAPVPNPPILPPNVPGNMTFTAGTWNINPADGARATDGSVPPQGVGPGSIVTCVQPVTYWVDDQGRLRMWIGSPADPSGSTALTGAYGSVPANPAADAVLAEGVEDLQVALRMSGQAGAFGRANVWAFSNPGNGLGLLTEAVETRSVRLTFLLRTPRADDGVNPQNVPDQLEDHDITALIDQRFRYRTISFQAELRNMRLFDLQSTQADAWTDIRSYPQ